MEFIRYWIGYAFIGLGWHHQFHLSHLQCLNLKLANYCIQAIMKVSISSKVILLIILLMIDEVEVEVRRENSTNKNLATSSAIMFVWWSITHNITRNIFLFLGPIRYYYLLRWRIGESGSFKTPIITSTSNTTVDVFQLKMAC